MKISIIVAIDEKNAIGYNNHLLCHLWDDLKYFKKITNWQVVVMGRNTFLSLPNWALPNRLNIVLTLSNDKFENCISCGSIKELFELDEIKDKEEIFIIWWASIYKAFFEIADKLYITKIHNTFENADVFFPEIGKEERTLISKSEIFSADEKNDYPYSFEIYQKII